MLSPTLETSVGSRSDVAIIELQGELDCFGDHTFRAAYAEVERIRPRAIILDFGRVAGINSCGIQQVITLLAHARREHRRVLAYGLSPICQKIFTITRLAEFIGVFADESSALTATKAVFRTSAASNGQTKGTL